MNKYTDSTQGDEMVAKLIAAAGKGPTATAAARQRVYATVRARWEEEIGARSRQNERVSSRRRPRLWNPRGLAMAAAIGAVAISLAFLQTMNPGNDGGRAVASLALVQGGAEILRTDGSVQLGAPAADQTVGVTDRLATAADGRVALRFNDGLSLRMNSDTELRVVAADEVELLRGTIYIDSGVLAANSALRVRTPFGTVEHLGTQYQVDVGSSNLQLRVREGRVSIAIDGVEEIGTAGEQLTVEAGGSTARSTIAADDASWDWVIGLATLPAAASYAVDETLEWIARERGLALEYAPASIELRLGRETLVGLEGLDPVAALAVVARTNGLSSTIAGGTLTISD